MKKWMIKHPVLSILLIALFSILIVAWVVCGIIFKIDILVYGFFGLLMFIFLLAMSAGIYFIIFIIIDDNY